MTPLRSGLRVLVDHRYGAKQGSKPQLRMRQILALPIFGGCHSPEEHKYQEALSSQGTHVKKSRDVEERHQVI